MEDIYYKIKKIEDELRENEHTEGQVGFYFASRNGYLWSACRVVCKCGEYVLLDFYICD